MTVNKVKSVIAQRLDRRPMEGLVAPILGEWQTCYERRPGRRSETDGRYSMGKRKLGRTSEPHRDGLKRRQAGEVATKRAAGSRHSARLERAERTRKGGRVVIDSEDEHTLGMALSHRRKIRIHVEAGDSE